MQGFVLSVLKSCSVWFPAFSRDQFLLQRAQIDLLNSNPIPSNLQSFHFFLFSFYSSLRTQNRSTVSSLSASCLLSIRLAHCYTLKFSLYTFPYHQIFCTNWIFSDLIYLPTCFCWWLTNSVLNKNKRKHFHSVTIQILLLLYH